MKFEIKWSDYARKSFREVVKQIEEKWTVKEVSAFIKKMNNTFDIISHSPYAYPSTRYENIRRAVISRQTSVLYRVSEEYIEILFFWDNRQDPLF